MDQPPGPRPEPALAPDHEPRRAWRGVAIVGAAVALVAAVAIAVTVGNHRDDGTSQPPQGIIVRRVTIDEPVNGTTAAVRMIIDNRSGASDRLVAASSDVARSATLHRSTTDELDRSTMQDLTGVDIPAQTKIVFSPGGLHVMLSGLRRPLEIGDTVDVTLVFQHAGSQTIDAEVVPLGTVGVHDMDQMDGAPHDHG